MATENLPDGCVILPLDDDDQVGTLRRNTCMSKKSHYVVQPAESALCPKCENQMRLLCHVLGAMTANRPAFYLCLCGYIAQVGVGPVAREGFDAELDR